VKEPNVCVLKSLIAVLLGLGLVSGAFAVASGPQIMEPGAGAFYPTGRGAQFSVDWLYQDQNQNWNGTSSASSVDNWQKEIRSNFFQLNGGFQFNESWGLQIELPVVERYYSYLQQGAFLTNFDHAGTGDVRLVGMYTGFSPDMSTGFTFGVKLPTGGDSGTSYYDSGTAIGTRSTDLLLGVYHFAEVPGFSHWIWWMDFRLDLPVLTQNNYVPGSEIDQALGVRYEGLFLAGWNFSPFFQVSGAYRWNDTGANSDKDNSGFNKYFADPGLQVDADSWRLVTAFGIPFYQNYNGNQLAAPVLVKVQVAYRFQ